MAVVSLATKDEKELGSSDPPPPLLKVDTSTTKTDNDTENCRCQATSKDARRECTCPTNSDAPPLPTLRRLNNVINRHHQPGAFPQPGISHGAEISPCTCGAQNEEPNDTTTHSVVESEEPSEEAPSFPANRNGSDPVIVATLVNDDLESGIRFASVIIEEKKNEKRRCSRWWWAVPVLALIVVVVILAVLRNKVFYPTAPQPATPPSQAPTNSPMPTASLQPSAAPSGKSMTFSWCSSIKDFKECYDTQGCTPLVLCDNTTDCVLYSCSQPALYLSDEKLGETIRNPSQCYPSQNSTHWDYCNAETKDVYGTRQT